MNLVVLHVELDGPTGLRDTELQPVVAFVGEPLRVVCYDNRRPRHIIVREMVGLLSVANAKRLSNRGNVELLASRRRCVIPIQVVVADLDLVLGKSFDGGLEEVPPRAIPFQLGPVAGLAFVVQQGHDQVPAFNPPVVPLHTLDLDGHGALHGHAGQLLAQLARVADVDGALLGVEVVLPVLDEEVTGPQLRPPVLPAVRIHVP
jgi:hypothetical protein